MSNRRPVRGGCLLAMLLIVVSAIAFTQTQGILATRVYGASHAGGLANALPMLNATVNATITANSTSTSTSSSTTASISYSTASAMSTTYGSTGSYSTIATTVASFTSSYAIVTATIPSVQTVNPDFALSVSDPVVYLLPGDFVGTTSFILTVTAIGRWAGQLQFTTSPLPRGIALFNMPWRYSLNSPIASWNVQVVIGPSASVASYELVINAISGPTVHSTAVTIIAHSLTVLPAIAQFLSLVSALLLMMTISRWHH